VFDLISAKIADRFEFPALYMTGYGVVASSLGLPDAGLASYTEMVDRVAKIARAAPPAFNSRTRSFPRSAGTRRAAG
jgi:2-methylisocitrate lyase-like PEP mutase family enzyme